MALTEEERRELFAILRTELRKELNKVREDVQKLSERVDELNYKFSEYREWTDLRFSTLCETLYARPVRRRRRKVFPSYGLAGDGCNSTHAVMSDPF